MPTYEYVCSKCKHHFEKFQRMTEKALKVCPQDLCPRRTWGRGAVKRVMGAGAGLIFKGDAAFVAFVAEVEYKVPEGPVQRTLRIADFYTKQDGAWIQTGSDTELHPESVAERSQTLRKLSETEKKNLLEAREAVWRAYFAGNRAALERRMGQSPSRPGKFGALCRGRRQADTARISEDGDSGVRLRGHRLFEI